MKTFADREKSLRREYGMSQEDMAALLKKGRTTISGYENAGKEPDFATACFIADYFGVTTDYLLGRSDERENVRRTLYGDDFHFELHLRKLPDELSPIVSECFNWFYRLLDPDVQRASGDQLSLYADLMQKLQFYRSNIHASVSASCGNDANPAALASLSSMQTEFKNAVCVILDKLMQADVDAAFNVKSKTGTGSDAEKMA